MPRLLIISDDLMPIADEHVSVDVLRQSDRADHLIEVIVNSVNDADELAHQRRLRAGHGPRAVESYTRVAAG